MSSSYRLTLENWLKELDVNANSVLDIGGSQQEVRKRVRSWEVKDYKIADLPDPHEDSPQPDIVIDLNSPIYKADQQFDIIFCLEVMEYVYNPFFALAQIAEYLNDNGTAWVSFPSFYPLHNPIEDDCLRYMPAGIKKLAQSAGLQVAQMIPRRPETGALLQYFSAERLRAAKGTDHMFMGWIVELKK